MTGFRYVGNYDVILIFNTAQEDAVGFVSKIDVEGFYATAKEHLR